MVKPKSLSHIKRYRQIASVFTKYGLKDFITYVKLLRIPKPLAEPRMVKETGLNLRLAIQELGPTFIKGGQLLSSRSDLLPKSITNQLQKLLDEVIPVDFSQIMKVLNEQLGDVNKIFSYIDDKPLASASLAQVHKAKLKSGQTVALKIQRPDIKQQISVDIDILYDAAAILQDRLSYLKAYNLTEIVNEFRKNINSELDFELEGLNLENIACNLQEFKYIKMPKVYKQYSTKKILCLEYIEGLKITQKDEIEKSGIDTANLVWQILDAYSKQIYVDGFFQADPHIGNIFIRSDGVVQLIDFGSIGKLDENLRKEIATLVFHFIFKEGEQAAESLLKMGAQKRHTNYTALKNDVSLMIGEYTNMPDKYFSIGQGLLSLTRIAAKHNVEVPANFSLVGKTFLLLDDIVRILDPDFSYNDYLSHLAPILLYERLQSDYAPQKALRNFMELTDLLSSFPQKLNYFINKIIKDDLHVVFRHEGLEKITDGISAAGFAIALSLTAAGLSFLAILSFLMKFVIVATILGALATTLIIYLMYKMLRRIKW